MVKKTRYNSRPVRPRHPQSAARMEKPAPEIREKKIPVVYGQPFILLEDEQKNTFEYKGGAWVPHTMTIAQCRVDCQVKELSQKINRMTRYEIRSPVSGGI
jgi:hypothetical protein